MVGFFYNLPFYHSNFSLNGEYTSEIPDDKLIKNRIDNKRHE